MSVPARARPARRARRRWPLAAGAALAFLLGIALGSALDDNPEPGRTATYERTYLPATLGSVSSTTVTVTVTAPSMP